MNGAEKQLNVMTLLKYVNLFGMMYFKTNKNNHHKF